MVEVYLHGIFEEKFRSKYEFELESVSDVLKAIDAVESNFMTFLARNFDQMEFSMLVDGKVASLEDANKKDMKRIDILPAAKGAFLFTFIVGLVVSIGVSVIMAANSVQAPTMDNASTQSAKTSSYSFRGETNVESQGKPVPLGYGRLRVGSNVIGNQTWNRNLFR
jgi:predicted phage tail protein